MSLRVCFLLCLLCVVLSLLSVSSSSSSSSSSSRSWSFSYVIESDLYHITANGTIITAATPIRNTGSQRIGYQVLELTGRREVKENNNNNNNRGEEHHSHQLSNLLLVSPFLLSGGSTINRQQSNVWMQLFPSSPHLSSTHGITVEFQPAWSHGNDKISHATLQYDSRTGQYKEEREGEDWMQHITHSQFTLTQREQSQQPEQQQQQQRRFRGET